MHSRTPFLIHPCPGDQCDGCKGKCLIPDKKTFEVHIEQGMKHGSKITLRGEAGCSEPGLAPGDIILVVVQKEHDVFQRANIDLVMEKSISLADALTGCSFTFKHLDGRVLRVTIPQGGEAGEGAWGRDVGISAARHLQAGGRYRLRARGRDYKSTGGACCRRFAFTLYR